MVKTILHTADYRIVLVKGVGAIHIFHKEYAIGRVMLSLDSNVWEIDEAYIHEEHQRNGLYYKALMLFSSINPQPIMSFNRSPLANSFWEKHAGALLDVDDKVYLLAGKYLLHI